jgi:hypothetical protein
MRSRVITLLGVLSLLAAGPSGRLAAQDHAAHHPAATAATSDSAYRALQARGAGTMGVDQYASRHTFEDRPDGGRIELQMREADSAAVAAIRAHLQRTVTEFRAGVFTAPEATHAMVVPGTVVMGERKGRVRYQYRPLAQGGEILIATDDPVALAAIREFLAFQRSDHRTGH